MTVGQADVLAPPPDGDVAPGPAPTFSVIVAAHNAEETIAESLRSALDQIPPPLEVVVCDDGSTDRTAEVLATFGERVTVVRKAQGGEASAKNAAARAASGDFVVILDADDVYLPGRLDALGQLGASRPDLDILTTDGWFESEGTYVARCYSPTHRFEVDDQRRGILHRNFVFGLAAIRRTRFLEVGGFDEAVPFSADWDCWIRLVLGGSRVGLVCEPLASYRLHQGSMNADRLAMYRGRAQTMARAWARDDLTEAERSTLRERMDHESRRIAVEELRSALAARDPRGRAIAAAAARRRDLPRSARAKAAAAAVLPTAAGALIRRDRARYWTAAADIRLPRTTA